MWWYQLNVKTLCLCLTVAAHGAATIKNKNLSQTQDLFSSSSLAFRSVRQLFESMCIHTLPRCHHKALVTMFQAKRSKPNAALRLHNGLMKSKVRSQKAAEKIKLICTQDQQLTDLLRSPQKRCHLNSRHHSSSTSCSGLCSCFGSCFGLGSNLFGISKHLLYIFDQSQPRP